MAQRIDGLLPWHVYLADPGLPFPIAVTDRPAPEGQRAKAHACYETADCLRRVCSIKPWRDEEQQAERYQEESKSSRHLRRGN